MTNYKQEKEITANQIKRLAGRLGGAKSKLTEELAISMHHYIEGGYKDYDQVIPSVAGLAVHAQVNTNTIYAWRDKHEWFRDMLTRLKDIQHAILLNEGLEGNTNATITKLVLAKHGYADKVETEHNHNIKTELAPAVFEGVAKDVTPKPAVIEHESPPETPDNPRLNALSKRRAKMKDNKQ